MIPLLALNPWTIAAAANVGLMAYDGIHIAARFMQTGRVTPADAAMLAASAASAIPIVGNVVRAGRVATSAVRAAEAVKVGAEATKDVARAYAPAREVVRRAVTIKGPDGTAWIRVSKAEADIYRGLQPKVVNGRQSLVRNDIDWNAKVDAWGRTNLERAQQGLSPYGPNGRPLEIHHQGQKNSGMFAELTTQQHRGPGNNTILHPIREGSEVVRGPEWQKFVSDYWKERAADLGGINV